MNQRSAFNAEMARFLAERALAGKTVTYGEFARQFGLANQGCGPVLTGIAQWLHAHGQPLLSIIVVNKSTGLPSIDARVYEQMGISSEADAMAEIRRCHDYDWSAAAFMR
ncbi:hypothetical protein [Marinibacterium sp. SX1]|uniref:hypothetical protein n=1 Tax=Marinibacterium sp. SX1 TaxID=3388424 RepID=UPI003D176A50